MNCIKFYLIPTLLCVLALAFQVHSMEQNEIEGSSEKSLVALNDQAHDGLDYLSDLSLGIQGKISCFLNEEDIWNLSCTNKTNMRNHSDDLSELPMDMKGKISSYLERKDIWNFSRTNKANNSAIEHPGFKRLCKFNKYERFEEVFTADFIGEGKNREDQKNRLTKYLDDTKIYNIQVSIKIINDKSHEHTLILTQNTHVKSLEIYNNIDNDKLTTLPPKIGQHIQLTDLDLSYNKLTILSPEIGQLINLRILKLHYNRLTTLPSEIAQLTQLKILTLHKNQLKTLPQEIGQLSQLKELNLSYNQLRTLPSEFGQLIQLTNLDLSYNHLETLPPEIGQLTKLHTLNLSSNRLTTVPQEIGQFTQLRTLNLRYNRLSREFVNDLLNTVRNIWVDFSYN